MLATLASLNLTMIPAVEYYGIGLKYHALAAAVMWQIFIQVLDFCLAMRFCFVSDPALYRYVAMLASVSGRLHRASEGVQEPGLVPR